MQHQDVTDQGVMDEDDFVSRHDARASICLTILACVRL